MFLLGILATPLHSLDFFTGDQKPEELVKQGEEDTAKVYNNAKKIAYKYFTQIYEASKSVAGANKSFMNKASKFKSEVEKIYKESKDPITEFGKISVYFTKLYLLAMDTVKKANADIFNEKIKRTPDQMADELFELDGANPLEIKNAAKDAAAILGISADQWEAMLDKGKAEARS